MPFQLPELPYSNDALEPHISAKTLSFHHGKHHRGYVEKLNDAVDGTEKAKRTLEELIRSEGGKIFNLAAQAWNHDFYWKSMSPAGGGLPKGKIADAIDHAFGSFDRFRKQFSGAAAGEFGSGWAWLVQEKAGGLAVVTTHDAGNPLVSGSKPVLTLDVWEHAYYLDYQNARPKYIEAWWELVNWEFAQSNLA